MIFPPRKLTLLPLCLLATAVWADNPDSDYIVRRGPTMAAFYSVAEDGRSVPEAVDAVVIADPHAKPITTIVTGRSNGRQQAPSQTVQLEVKILVKPIKQDSFAEFRCERSGFYYTSKGDCVIPAAAYRYAVPGKIYGVSPGRNSTMMRFGSPGDPGG